MRIDPDALRKAREAKGMNPSQLSREAGFARTYVHRLENGSRGSNVSHETITGLSKVLGVEPGTLLLDDPPELSSATPEGPDAGSARSANVPEPDPNPEAWRWG